MKDTITQDVSPYRDRLFQSFRPYRQTGGACFSKSNRWSCNARPADEQNHAELFSHFLDSRSESYQEHTKKDLPCQPQSMTEEKNQRIFKHVEKYRIDKSLNDGDIANELGISKQHYSQIKLGKKGIGAKTMSRITRLLGKSEGELLELPSDQVSQEGPDLEFLKEQIRSLNQQVLNLTATINNLTSILAGKENQRPFPKGVSPKNQNGKK